MRTHAERRLKPLSNFHYLHADIYQSVTHAHLWQAFPLFNSRSIQEQVVQTHIRSDSHFCFCLALGYKLWNDNHRMTQIESASTWQDTQAHESGELTNGSERERNEKEEWKIMRDAAAARWQPTSTSSSSSLTCRTAFLLCAKRSLPSLCVSMCLCVCAPLLHPASSLSRLRVWTLSLFLLPEGHCMFIRDDVCECIVDGYFGIVACFVEFDNNWIFSIPVEALKFHCHLTTGWKCAYIRLFVYSRGHWNFYSSGFVSWIAWVILWVWEIECLEIIG